MGNLHTKLKSWSISDAGFFNQKHICVKKVNFHTHPMQNGRYKYNIKNHSTQATMYQKTSEDMLERVGF